MDGINLAKAEQLADAGALYDELMALILKFASFGLIHCDFNEFNIMVSDKGVVTVIDFPQMVSVAHENAQVRDSGSGEKRGSHVVCCFSGTLSVMWSAL